MKKRILSLILTLALCLGLSVSALAAGQTSVYADNGWDGFSGTFTFSKAVTGTEDRYGEPVYLLPVGTVITFRDANGDTGMKGWYDTGSGEQYFENVTSFTVKEGEACVGGAFKDSPYIFIKGGNGSTKPTEPEQPKGDTPFTDVPGGAWFEEPIKWAVNHGITAGTSATTFSPDQTCTRGQIITFLWRAANSLEPDGGSAFNDVKESDYFFKPTQWASEYGVETADPNGPFNPNSPCTRAMAVEFLWNLVGAPEMEPVDNFTDVSADDACSQAVAWALANGITAGTSATTFSPDATCTRAQIMTFLYKNFVG